MSLTVAVVAALALFAVAGVAAEAKPAGGGSGGGGGGSGGGKAPAACGDGVDNDGDGLTDYPNDPGCTTSNDKDESNPPPAACGDGTDNDGDGSVDYPNDPGCTSATDTDETDAAAACADGLDNDGDGKVDHPNDPGCSSPSDADESNAGTPAPFTTEFVAPFGASGIVAHSSGEFVLDVSFQTMEVQPNGLFLDYSLFGSGSAAFSMPLVLTENQPKLVLTASIDPRPSVAVTTPPVTSDAASAFGGFAVLLLPAGTPWAPLFAPCCLNVAVGSTGPDASWGAYAGPTTPYGGSATYVDVPAGSYFVVVGVYAQVYASDSNMPPAAGAFVHYAGDLTKVTVQNF